MARGDLSQEVQARIGALLPDPMSRADEILSLSPDLISIAFDPESYIPVASVCLRDALGTMSKARYALFEGHAHGIYYREVASPPEEMLATWYEEFYIEDAAHRLYGAAEDIAEALIMMLEIIQADLKTFRGRAVSQQRAIGRLLLKQHPGLTVTRSIKALTESPAWDAAMKYRGRLVHEQPPLVAGLGIVHRRERRWQKMKGGGLRLALGGGDPPEFNTAALIATCRDALAALLTVFDDSLQQLKDILLQKAGIHRGPDGVLVIPDYSRNRLKRSAQEARGVRQSGPAAGRKDLPSA